MTCANVGPSKLYGLERYHGTGFLGLAGRQYGFKVMSAEIPSPGVWWAIANADVSGEDAERLARSIWLTIAAENEACARVADDASAWCRSFGAEETAEHIAAAIRARTTTGETK